MSPATSRRGCAVLSVDPPRFDVCASSTPPTGISGGPSTGRACSRTRLRTSTTCSRWSTRSGSTWSWWPATSTTARCPHVDAVRLADETLARLAASRAKVVLTSGNHDSAQRLGLQLPADRRGRRLHPHRRRHRSAPRCCSRTSTARSPSTASPTSTPTPCREPWGARRAARTRPRSPRRCAGCAPTWPAPRAPRSVVLAHAFVAGAEPSDSERDISVGGVSIVPTTVFDGVDYAALGHLHGRHTLTDADPLQRLPAGVLLLRGRPPQGLLAGRPRPRTASRRASSSRRRCRGRWPGSAAPSTSCSPTPARRARAVPGCRRR